MLLETSDRSLLRLDRSLRRTAAARLLDAPPATADLPSASIPGGRSLTLIYTAVAAWYRSEWEAAMADLRASIAATEIPFLRARATQMLVYLLFMSCDEERDGNQAAQAEAHEKECRELCERGLKEYGGAAWSGPVLGVLETALGVLDFPGDRFTSRLHLGRALKTEGWARRDIATFCAGCLGFASLYMGHHCLQDDDAVAAARHYEKAAGDLFGALRLHASIYLLEALSRSEDFKQVGRVARRTLRRTPAGERSGFQAVEVKRYLAQALIKMGRPNRAEPILREIAAAPGEQTWKPAARRWLEARSSARPRQS